MNAFPGHAGRSWPLLGWRLVARTRGGVHERFEIAGLFERERSAVDVLEEHLAAIASREDEIHAFNLVLVEEAQLAAAAVDAKVVAGEDPGPLAGVPVALKDNMCTRGIPTTCSSRILEGWTPPYDATVVTRLKAGRGGDRRQDQSRRVRHGIEHGELGVRADPQPARHDAGSRRVERWECCRGRRRLRDARVRQRHRRFDSSTGGAVRRRRGEADLRGREPDGPRRLCLESRPDRPVRHHRRRRCPRPRGHRRTRSRRLDVDPPAGTGPAIGARRRRRGIARRTDHRSAHRRRPGRGRASRRGVRCAQRCRGEDRRRRGAGVHLRAHRLLPRCPLGGVEQPRPLRRCALRPACAGGRHQRDVHGHASGRLR